MKLAVLARIVTIAAGVWLMVAPAVLGYGDPAAANDRLVGPTVAASAFVALWGVLRPVRWVAAPLGLWLLVAPSLFGYDQVSTTISSIITGVVVVASTPPGSVDPGRFGGGWRSLWRSEESPSEGTS